MNDFDDVRLEERNVYSATKWGVIAIIYSIIVNIILKAQSSIILNPREIIDLGLFTTFGLLYLSTWVVRILITIWVVRIAAKLNRSTFFWGLFGFIFPPITLIVIGFKDYRIEDENIRKIIEETRLDFRAELSTIKNAQNLSEDKLNQIEIELKERYNNELRKKILDFTAKERAKQKNIERTYNTENTIILESDEEELPQSENHSSWLNDINNCPACGARIGDKTVICPECGLTIN